MTAGRGYWMPEGSGRWMPGAEYARLRVSDVDRDRTADVLRAAFVEGRLTQDELDTRLGETYAARTYADLAAQTADLPSAARPGPPLPQPVPGPVPAKPSGSEVTNGLAVASLVCGLLQLFSLGLTAIPAIVLGYAARGQIRRTGERGEGLATAGLVLGWLGIAFVLLMVVGVAAMAVTTGHHAGQAPISPGFNHAVPLLHVGPSGGPPSP
jgi:Domain of unknown function (DUF4190)/Domain of unknown function (DUF1707)